MKFSILALAAAASLSLSSAALAQSLVENTAPDDLWSYGSGNNYLPANTVVYTTTNGNQLYGRAHQTFFTAPASSGGTYNFATGLPFISSDWGVFSNTGSLDGVTVAITLTNYATNQTFSFDGRAPGNDNHTGDSGEKNENSFRHNWFAGATGFSTMTDGLYQVRMDVGGLDDGAWFMAYDLKVGNPTGLTGNGAIGGAVPEPGTWALMILGFGSAGAMLRRRRLAFA